MKISKCGIFTIAIFSLFSLVGCIGVPIAILSASMIRGMVSDSKNYVEADLTTINPEITKSLAQARKLTIISNDEADGYTATELELVGRYDEVFVEPAIINASPSQMKRHAKRICEEKSAPDIVLTTIQGESDMGSKTVLTGMFTGKVKTDISGNVQVFRCTDSWTDNFLITVHIEQGVYNADQFEMSRDIGKSWANVLIKLAENGRDY